MDRSLVDTDIFSEILKRVDPRVARRRAAYLTQYARYTLSVMTVMEIVKGFHQLGREAHIQEFLKEIDKADVLPLTTDGAILAGRIYGDLVRIGRPIGVSDTVIAALALHHDLTLVTGNTAHYQHVQSLGYALRLDNWRE